MHSVSDNCSEKYVGPRANTYLWGQQSALVGSGNTFDTEEAFSCFTRLLLEMIIDQREILGTCAAQEIEIRKSWRDVYTPIK